MIVLLLGAGYATRLYPLTKDRPKPLLPVGGVPMLERIVEKVLAIDGVEKICIVSNHRFIANYERWIEGYRPRMKKPLPIRAFDDSTSSDEDKLGAIGDIEFVRKRGEINSDLLIVAGDNLFEFELTDVVRFAREKKSSVVALKDMKGSPLISKYSVVTLDSTSRIIDFEEKPPAPKATLISLGVYYFQKEHLPLIDLYIKEGHNKDAPGYYIQWLHQQIALYGYVTKGRWFDIGDIDSYNRANEIYASRY